MSSPYEETKDAWPQAHVHGPVPQRPPLPPVEGNTSRNKSLPTPTEGVSQYEGEAGPALGNGVVPPLPSSAPPAGFAMPQPAPATRNTQPPPWTTWGYGTQGVHAISVWTERVPGRGEDAEPLVAFHLRTRKGLIGVFDGSGGSGSSPAWQAPDGTQRTGAWVGSRVARLAMDCWFQATTETGDPADPDYLKNHLDFFHEQVPQRRSKIAGRMRRQLPTTLAAVEYHLTPDLVVEGRALWAGDSRAYLLDPESGLQVLTRDHTEESDALELLRSDPPMTNVVCADRDFFVDEHHFEFALPCVLMAATDGFFGYVHTPADFENTLLSTLRRAGSEAEWADLIRAEVESYTADDASLCLVALGYKDFEHLRSRFGARQEFIADFCRKGRPTGADPAHTVRTWQDATWHDYRPGYEAYLPAPGEEQA